MASLPPIRRLTREDFPEAPAWIDRLLFPINSFFDSVYVALNQTLTFKENISSQTEKFDLRAGAAANNNTYTFPLRMKRRPEFMEWTVAKKGVNYSPIGAAVFIEWQYDGTNVKIWSVTGLTSSVEYSFTVRLT